MAAKKILKIFLLPIAIILTLFAYLLNFLGWFAKIVMGLITLVFTFGSISAIIDYTKDKVPLSHVIVMIVLLLLCSGIMLTIDTVPVVLLNISSSIFSI